MPVVLLATLLLTQSAITADLDLLLGAKWIGSLTYRDFSTDRRTTIPVEVTFTRGEKLNEWVGAYRYPEEADANATVQIVVSPDGTMINNERVIERARLRGSAVRIVTSRDDKDNDKRATVRQTYLISPTRLAIIREVSYGAEYSLRHQYRFSRLLSSAKVCFSPLPTLPSFREKRGEGFF